MDEQNKTTAFYDKDFYQYEVDTEKKESLNLFCNFCRRRTSHKTLVRVDTKDENPDNIGTFFGIYRITECCGCHSICFVERTFSSEDEGVCDELISEFPCVVYPTPEEFTPTERGMNPIDIYLPDGVRRIYRESLEAIKNRMFILAGIGMRTILDVVCRDNKIGNENDSLSKRLAIMLDERRLITPDEKTILDAVRDIGNDSAHEGKLITYVGLHSALTIIDHLLNKLYLIPRMKDTIENKANVKLVEDPE